MISFAPARLIQAGTAVAVSLLLVSTSAPLQAAPATGKDAATRTSPQQADANRQICVRLELSGTRMARRVCKTAAEWQRAGGVPNQD